VPKVRRSVSSKFEAFAGLLDDTLAPYQYEEVAEAIRTSATPEAGGTFNCNNDIKFAKLSSQHVLAIIRAFETNKTAVSVQMANLRLTDEAAVAWASVLRVNRLVASLNLEGNAIGADGVAALSAVLREGSGLRELKLAHQHGKVLPAAVELELARSAESSTSLLKLTSTLRQIQAREIIDRTLMRNNDAAGRLKRLSTKRLLEAAGEIVEA